jgi:hypothetical protein
MKVIDVIKKLTENYSPYDEIMVAWWDASYKETSYEIWEKAVQIYESEDNRYQMSDYINDCIIDAEIYFENQAEQAELAVDSYLHDLAEKELNDENV